MATKRKQSTVQSESETWLRKVAEALARPDTSYVHAAEKLGCDKRKVTRAAYQLGGEAVWSFLPLDEANVAVAKLPELLRLLCARTPALFNAFWKASQSAAEEPLSLVLSFDEATAGNVLAPDPAKKACIMYIGCKEVGTQDPALWWPVSVIRSETLKHHNFGKILRHFLLTNPAEQLQGGFLLESAGQAPFIVRVRIAAVIADGEALRQALSCKGAAGLKPCFNCKNIVMRGHAMTGCLDGYLEDIASVDRANWDAMTDADLFEFSDEQRRKKVLLSKTAFEKEETLSGVVYNPDSLLQDAWARSQLPPSIWMYDFLHIYYTKGGVASLELALLVDRACSTLEIEHEHLAALLREHCWQVPGHVQGFSGPSTRARLLDTARFMEGGYKSKAADLQQLMPLLPALLEMLDTDQARLLGSQPFGAYSFYRFADSNRIVYRNKGLP